MKCINPEPNRNCTGEMKSNKDGYSFLPEGTLECDTCGFRTKEQISDTVKIAKAIKQKGIDLTKLNEENN